MSKVKESISLMVKIPGELVETPITVDYESIWTPCESIWRFQTWIDYAKCFVNVQGRFNKDGLISRKDICVTTCRVANTFWLYPAQTTPIRSRVVGFK